MDPSTSPEARAAQLASIGLATSTKAGADIDLISAMVFEHAAAIRESASIAPAVPAAARPPRKKTL